MPPGSFLMGSPESEKGRRANEKQHPVTLTAGFWLGVHPVTQAQWEVVMGSNPSKFKGENRPVERVLWDDCQAFCRQLGVTRSPTLALPFVSVRVCSFNAVLIDSSVYTQLDAPVR